MAWTIDSDLLGLEDKVAVVTGGGGAGMGGQHCRQLARAGCDIVVADIDEDGGQATVKAVEEIGRRAIFVKANTRVRADVDDLLKATLGAFGRLDIAVNHVGGMGETGPTPFLDYADEGWDDVIEHNLKSTFLCCRAEALEMIRQGTEGRIINVASSSGVVGAESIAAYGASKAGVIHLTKSLAQELARYGIRVNCIVPGTHTNPRQEAMLNDPDVPEERKAFMRRAGAAPPLGRLGNPWETAGLAVFFASNLSSYVTGTALLSDGGVTLTTARPPVLLGIEAEAVKQLRGS